MRTPLTRSRWQALAVGAALFTSALPGLADARVKLITLPVRERVEIQLDNERATLVEEERIVPLVKGVNHVDFSWANTQIDKNTIVFRVLGADGPSRVEVLSVSYPPSEQALVWQVAANDSGSARVRISYLLGGLGRSYSYRAVASKDEKTLTLSKYLLLENRANEEFGHAGLFLGADQRLTRPVALNETRKVRVARHKGVAVEKTYTADLARFGYLDAAKKKLLVPMHYVLTNDSGHGLGAGALPPGKVRIFQRDGRGTRAFIGEDWGRFTPVDDRLRLSLGVAQDIVVKRTIEKSNRIPVSNNLFHQEVVVKYEIENFKNKAVRIDVAEDVARLRTEAGLNAGRISEWEIGDSASFRGGFDKARSSLGRLVFHTKLPAQAKSGKAKKIVRRVHLIFKNEW